MIAGPEGDRFNLFATIGPRDRPGYILSGHTDVVPTEGQVWATDPFRLASDGVRLSGRGTTDMKGFLACALAMTNAATRLAFAMSREGLLPTALGRVSRRGVPAIGGLILAATVTAVPVAVLAAGGVAR